MEESGPGGGTSPPRRCGCLRFLKKRPIKPADGRAAASSSSTEESAAYKERPARAPAAAQPATLKPATTGRRSRSDSPKSEAAEEQPVKRQNSMGLDDPPIEPHAGAGAADAAQPMEEGGAAVPRSPATSTQTTQQLAAQQQAPPAQQREQQSAGYGGGNPGSPQHTAANACPPFGSKSVIGRRAKMEDACVAVPYLVEVPVSRSGMDELLPPRIAPALRSISAGSAASEQTGAAAAAAAARAEASAGASSSSPQAGQSPAHGAGGAYAMALDPPDVTSGGRSGNGSGIGQHRRHHPLATETLHFFGVFDGHGGADAALHCAKSLHERVRDVLSACSAPMADLLSPVRASRDHSAAAPQASSSGGGGGERGQEGATSSGNTDYQDAAAGPGDMAAADSSSSAASYLDSEFEDSGGALQGAANSVEGVTCTSETIEAALTKAFHITDEEFGNMGGYEHLALVGTTAVVALVGSRMIYVANCGDSRAVLCRGGGALPLTDDHKAAREDETARVEAAGGQILFWNGVRVMGLLAVSRAIGDHSLRPYVIAEPEVTVVTRHPSDEVLVMASDGLWDVMSNQEAVTLAKKCLGRARSRGSTRQSAARVAATVLTRAAVDRGSRDNVTVVIVDLSPMTQEEMETEARLTERSETVTVPDQSATAEQLQRMAPSGTALRSSSAAKPKPSAVPEMPPVQVSPFAGPGAAAASPFAELSATGPAPALAPAEAAAVASGAALVSPFSSGALPAGLDFDVQRHANAVAAATAAAGQQPSAQRQPGGGGSSGLERG